MLTEVVILAGGLGTRLREAVPELPKCMAPVNGKPFLDYVIRYFTEAGVHRFIFSLGYMSQKVQQFVANALPADKYVFVVEEEPLGTGGAIALSLGSAISTDVLITNGDTLFKADVAALMSFHLANNSACTLALKPMENFDRYGVVTKGDDGVINSFQEKRAYNEGLINGGLYALNIPLFRQKNFAQKFSFEKDYLEQYTHERNFFGKIDEGYFIDIGIPEDFNRAQQELKA